MEQTQEAQGPPTVDLGKLSVTLIEPPSLFALACGRDPKEAQKTGLAGDLAHGAACLRMCWPEKVKWPVRVRPKPWRLGEPVREYGVTVWEDLRAGTKGEIPFSALSAAAYEALRWTFGSALTADEVAGAADFSEGQEEE